MKQLRIFAARRPACIAVLLFVRAARAEGDAANSSSAQALFDLGKQLAAQGNYGEACPKFAESQRLDPGTGTLLNLADCYEHTNKLASAWSTFLEAAASARTAGQTEREQFAREHAATLAPRLSKLVVEVAPKEAFATGFSVQRDGEEVGRAQWGVAVPADSGEHAIEASAIGRKPWKTSIAVPDGAGTVKVQIPALVVLPRPPPPPPPPEARPWFSTHQKLAAIVVGGLGAVGIGLGTAFGLMVKPTYDKSNSYCNGNHCDPAGHDFRENAFDKATIANVAFGVGGAALVGGVVLWLTAPRTLDLHPPATAIRLDPAVGPGVALLSLRRNW